MYEEEDTHLPVDDLLHKHGFGLDEEDEEEQNYTPAASSIPSAIPSSQKKTSSPFVKKESSGESLEHMPDNSGPLECYLIDYERRQQTYKPTRFSSSRSFGKGEILDESKYNYGSYAQQQERFKKEQLEREAQLKQKIIEDLKKESRSKYLDPEESSFPYSELKGKFPEGVDPTKKEQYLADEEFEQVFGMDKDTFSKLGAFKKKSLKIKLNLF